MMKKTVLTLALLFVFSSMAFASPLTDYSKGNFSADLTFRPNLSVVDRYTGDGNGIEDQKGRGSTTDWGVTAGLGNNFALQFAQYNPVGKDSYGGYGMDTKELNLLYKLNKYTSVFAGYHRSGFVGGEYSKSSNTMQIGLIGQQEISPKTTLYGVAGFGNRLVNCEVGLGYQIADNTEVNFSYRYKKVNGLYENYGVEGSTYSDDVTARGFGLGVTYKF